MEHNTKKHNRFVNEHKYLIVALDVIMVLVILMNITASLITNMLVIKKTDTKIQFKEINPITSKVSDYEPHPKSVLLFMGILFSAILYVVLVYIYMYYRLTINNIMGLVKLSTITFVWCILFGMDLFNDLGYLIGVVWR